MKTFADLQACCVQFGLFVPAAARPNKNGLITALRQYHWEQDHPGEPLPPQIVPMLLEDWNDLTPEAAHDLEHDHHAWAVEPKLDGVRTLMHIARERPAMQVEFQ